MYTPGVVVNKGLTIAISGKGGVGKTGLAAMLIKCLSKHGSVLAIDADADSNLPNALGIDEIKSVGEVREKIVYASTRSLDAPDKSQAFEQSLHELIVEGDDFDLLVMGRSEGEGCYCAINTVLRRVIDYKANNYDFTVIDCEAGLEHLSRRTTRDVDIMIVVTDATVKGILTAKRVKQLSAELCIDFGQLMVIANKVTDNIRSRVDQIAHDHSVEITSYIPFDATIAEYDSLGRPLTELPDDSPALLAASDLCQMIISHLPQDSEQKLI
ncbi:MAG: AAA family ATPase [Chloroflexota bacterium]|nr:AAA family ATPase [Chloroflexota bacterium]